MLPPDATEVIVGIFVETLKLTAQTAAPGLRNKWKAMKGGLTALKYQQEVKRQYDKMHIFGMTQPVPLRDSFFIAG